MHHRLIQSKFVSAFNSITNAISRRAVAAAIGSTFNRISSGLLSMYIVQWKRKDTLKQCSNFSTLLTDSIESFWRHDESCELRIMSVQCCYFWCAQLLFALFTRWFLTSPPPPLMWSGPQKEWVFYMARECEGIYRLWHLIYHTAAANKFQLARQR